MLPVHYPQHAHQDPGGYSSHLTPSNGKTRLANNKRPGKTVRLPEDPTHKRIPNRRSNKRKARRQADAQCSHPHVPDGDVQRPDPVIALQTVGSRFPQPVPSDRATVAGNSHATTFLHKQKKVWTTDDHKITWTEYHKNTRENRPPSEHRSTRSNDVHLWNQPGRPSKPSCR